MEEAIQWEGDWVPIMEFLDQCAGGKMEIPFGHRPPVRTRNEYLVVENRSGETLGSIGSWLVFDREAGEFHIEQRSGR